LAGTTKICESDSRKRSEESRIGPHHERRFSGRENVCMRWRENAAAQSGGVTEAAARLYPAP
jgi:hypothetical protein